MLNVFLQGIGIYFDVVQVDIRKYANVLTEQIV